MPEPSSNAPGPARVPANKPAATSPPKSPPAATPVPSSVEPGAFKLSPQTKLRLVVALCFVASIGFFATYVGGLRGSSDVAKHRILNAAKNTAQPSSQMGRMIEDDFSTYWKDELLCQYFLVISVVLAYAGSGLLLVDRVWAKLRQRKREAEKADAPEPGGIPTKSGG